MYLPCLALLFTLTGSICLCTRQGLRDEYVGAPVLRTPSALEVQALCTTPLPPASSRPGPRSARSWVNPVDAPQRLTASGFSSKPSPSPLPENRQGQGGRPDLGQVPASPSATPRLERHLSAAPGDPAPAPRPPPTSSARAPPSPPLRSRRGGRLRSHGPFIPDARLRRADWEGAIPGRRLRCERAAVPQARAALRR